MRKSLTLLSVAACLALASLGVFAQAAGAIQAIGPLTRDLGALKTMTAQGAATVASADQSGYNVSRVVCAFNQSTYTGSPSTTFKIQNKDAASGLYYDLVASAAITSATTLPVPLAVGAGLPTTTNVSIGLPVAAKWRVSTTVGGTSTPTVTGTIGCSAQ